MTFRTSKISNQLKTNLVFFLNNLLLNNGYFDNIELGELDFEGNDLSEFFIHSDDSSFVTGSVWQSPRINWVSERDTVIPAGAEAPTDPSGVYINDIFVPKDDPNLGHVFDFENGRVIFTSGTLPLSTDLVQAEYSVKDVFVGIASKQTVHVLHNDFFANDAIFDSVFPSGATGVPALWIDVEGHTISPLALGGGKIINKIVHVHAISNDDGLAEIDDIADIISDQQYTTINIINIDEMPELFDFRGARTTTFREYTDMVSDESLFWNKVYWRRVDRVDVTTERSDWNRIRLDILFEKRDSL